MATNAMTDHRYTRYRLTVDQYYRMADVGVLAPDARTELIEGEILDMAPIGSRHAGTVAWLHRQLSRAVGDLAMVFTQSPARLSHITEPQPDVLLLRPRADYYRQAHPRAEDILLLIEVSDSTALYDYEIKMPLYASYGVREAWLVDLDAEQLIYHRAPLHGWYLETITGCPPGLTVLPSLQHTTVDLTQLFAWEDHSIS
jgi:Uma2 family endonuclease